MEDYYRYFKESAAVIQQDPQREYITGKQSKARFHVAVRTQINKFVFYFIVRRNVKFGCSEC